MSARKAHTGRRAGLLACLVTAATASGVLAAPVKFGDLGIVGDAPFYIAQEKGYFAQQKIEVQSQLFESAAVTFVPLSTNELQVVTGGLGAGLFNAFARDLPLRIVFGSTRDMPGYSSDTLLLRWDLRDSVTGIKDLRGKKIALNARAGSLEYILGRILQTESMTLTDVDLTYIGWPQQGAAFANKGIDVGAVSEPFAALYDEKKLAFPFKRTAETLKSPYVQVSVVLFSKTWMDKDPEQAKGFSIAYIQGMRDYYDAMKGGPKRAEVIDILARHTSLKDKQLYDRIQWSYMDPNGELVMDSLRDQVDWFAAHGDLAEPVALDKMVDRSYLDYVQQKLGRARAD